MAVPFSNRRTPPLASAVPGMARERDTGEADRLPKDAKSLIKRGKERRRTWETHWNDVYDYCFPYRDALLGDGQHEGEKRTDKIYDNTAVEAIPKFASRLVHGLFPPASQAFSIDPGTDVPLIKARSPQVRRELATITAVMHDWLRKSNFESEINEAAQDLGIGTMTMLVEEGTFPGQIVFTSVPVHSLYILPGKRDQVGTWIYERKMRVEEIRKTWPRARLSREMLAQHNANPDKELKIIDITHKGDDDLEGDNCTRWIWCEDYDHVLERFEYKGRGSCPWLTARWSKTTSEVWGRGPILNVLPSIKTVNLTVQLVLENAEFSIAGMFTYDDDGVFNPDTISVEPGMFIPKAKGSEVMPLQTPSRFDISQLILNDERMNIRRGLYVDELDRGDAKTPFSAEEVVHRRADMARNMGSVSGRVWHEFVVPLVDRMIYFGTRRWQVFNMPVIDGHTLRLTPLSPLLRVQDQADVSNLVTWGQVTNAMLGPGTAQVKLNQQRTADWLAHKMSLDLTILNTPEEEKRIQQQMQDAAAAVPPEGQGALVEAAIGGGLALQ